jgi:hypothetical protein
MTHDFDPGYVCEPFTSLVREYPGPDVYPPDDFRIEWGPIFHRGRLDGTARVLVIGQDPGQHENIARRILVGEAGQRVQGFLARLGIATSYTMVNAFLYSVFGHGGSSHHADPDLVDYRNRWLTALLVGTRVQAVVAFGGFADEAFTRWKSTPVGQSTEVAFEHVIHPTFPESASASGQMTRAAAMEQMLAGWNAALDVLRPAVTDPDIPQDPSPYGTALAPTDLAPIPERDLPAGVPALMHSLAPWALRSGETANDKRATIVVTVPDDDRPWTPLP